MKNKNNLGLIAVLLIACAYFFAQAFLPNFHLEFNYSIGLALLFFILAASGKSFLLAGIGGGFLAIYLQDLYQFAYQTTPLFVGLVLVGIILDKLKDRA